MSALRLLTVSFVMSALSVTKLVCRGSVDKPVRNVAKSALRKRFTLQQLLRTMTIPERSHAALLGKRVWTDGEH